MKTPTRRCRSRAAAASSSRRREEPEEHEPDRQRRSRRARCRARSARTGTAAARALAHRGDRLARVSRAAPGRIAAISVTTMPTSERDDDRARREHRADLRQVDPERDEQRVQPLREAEAEEEADDRRDRRRSRAPRARPTSSTCRRVAPSVRSVASSRMRCATVIPIVFAITKMPTKSATKPNASRKYSRMSGSRSCPSRPASPPAGPSAPAPSAGRTRRDLRDELRRRHARLRGDLDRVELALLVEDPLRGREVEDRHASRRRASSRRRSLHEPGDAEAARPARASRRRSCRRP